MQQLFDFAFARLDHAESKRREFGESWKQYISQHPWDIDVRNVTPTTFEIMAVTREQAPVQLSLAFSDWLATIRAALDNGLYAWVASATGQNPPPLAERIQYPICSTAKEYASQRKRLSGVPKDILDKVEAAQPYQSPHGPESNLFYWIHELARTDRHRSLHVGLGRVGVHRIRLRLPDGVTATFDESVKPYHQIVGELVVGRFTTSNIISRFAVEADLTGVGIDPSNPSLGRIQYGRTAAIPAEADDLHRALHTQQPGEHGLVQWHQTTWRFHNLGPSRPQREL